MPKEEKLKAFIVTFYVVNEENPRSLAIIAYDKKEACDMFVRWLKARSKYEQVTSFVCQVTRRTRKNAFMFSKERYDAQYDIINKLEAKNGKEDKAL